MGSSFAFPLTALTIPSTVYKMSTAVTANETPFATMLSNGIKAKTKDIEKANADKISDARKNVRPWFAWYLAYFESFAAMRGIIKRIPM